MILLSRDQRYCLLDHARRASNAKEAIAAATFITGYIHSPPLEYSVGCDEETADEILQLAIAHCPDTVGAIEEALRLARKAK
jgi:hypothetical protein